MPVFPAFARMLPWSLFYVGYSVNMAVWLNFAPARLMHSVPHWAAGSLALCSLAYFAALPAAQWTWRRLGFEAALGLWGGLATLAYLLPLFGPEVLALALPLGSLGAQGAYGLTETYLIELLTAQGRAQDFGPVRRWGSLGFLTAAAGSGLLLDLMGGVKAMEELLAVSALGLGLSCWWLMRRDRSAEGVLPPALATHAPDVGDSEPVTAEVDLIANQAPEPVSGLPGQAALGATALAVAAMALQRLGENQSSSWFAAMWIAHGHPASQAGVLVAWAVAAEFLAMGASARLLARIQPVQLMMVCTLVSAVRWWLVPACNGFACLAVLQTLHALSFGLFYPASLLWLRAHRPHDFFNVRFVMEGAWRAMAGGFSYLAASTLIPEGGYGSVYHACALAALLSVGLWLGLLMLHRKGMGPARSAP